MDIVFQNSFAALYLAQAATYGAAAWCSAKGDHKKLTHCYLGCALLHALFGACHVFHVG